MRQKWTFFIAVLLLTMAFGLASCDRDDSKQQPAQKSQSAPAEQGQDAAPSTSGSQAKQKENRTVPEAVWPPPQKDGVEVTLAGSLLAKNYYVVLDSSGSMREYKCSGNMTKSQAAKTALAHFARTVPKDANLGLCVFDGSGINEKIPLGLENREGFISAVNGTVPGNGTPLLDAIRLAYIKLEHAARLQAGYGEYHLVVVTDGQAEPASQDPTPIVRRILDTSPIVIHTIGFCIGTNHSLNQPRLTIYRAADNPGELQQGLEEVLAESPHFDVTGFK
ncbi:MAG: VWA domain-containing protein [Syntrophobacteraceae bacterium]